MDTEQLITYTDMIVFRKTHRHLRDIEVWILREAWNGSTYGEIATRYNYAPQYLCQDIGPKLWKLLSEVLEENVGKRNFRTCLERYVHCNRLELKDLYSSNTPKIAVNSRVSAIDHPFSSSCDASPMAQYDWQDAPHGDLFYGRDEELARLKDWILGNAEQDSQSAPCRLMVLTGMVGMGKTQLAINLAQQLSTAFEFIIWRSLRNEPDVHTIVESCLQLFSEDATGIGQSLESKIHHLLGWFRRHRCLLILDDFDSVLQGSSSIGAYGSHHEGYGLLLRYLADAQHQSCLVITTREKPQGLLQREGDTLSVRSLRVRGIDYQAVERIFRDRGYLGVESEDYVVILNYFGGNPLLIKIFASSLRIMMGGNLKEFMPLIRQGICPVSEIMDVLQRQTLNLSQVQKQILYCLALHADQLTLIDLVTHCACASPQQLLTALQSLLRRSLIEREGKMLYLLPVVSGYVTDFLISEQEKMIWHQQGIFSPTQFQVYAQHKEKSSLTEIAA
jgi:NACHT domain